MPTRRAGRTDGRRRSTSGQEPSGFPVPRLRRHEQLMASAWLPVRANGSTFPDPTAPRYGSDPRSDRCNDPPKADTSHPRVLR